MDEQQKREIAKKDHERSIEILQIFRGDVRYLDRKLFDFKLAFAGLLGISLTIIFSNIHYFSNWFLISILTITLLTFASSVYEIWKEAMGKMKNLKDWERETILNSVRQVATIYPKLEKYGLEVQEIHSKEHKILQAMEKNMSLEDIVKNSSSKYSWKLGVFWWSLLFLSIPTLFIVQLIYPNIPGK